MDSIVMAAFAFSMMAEAAGRLLISRLIFEVIFEDALM